MSLYDPGTASIFVNDDGLAYATEEDAQARKNFYHDNNIGWVSRPKNGEDGFIRKGKFKKASNMNFALNISNKVEDLLYQMVNEHLERHGEISAEDEDRMYNAALQAVLSADSRAKADGNIRMGEIILIVDSDTRVVSYEHRLSSLHPLNVRASLSTVCSTELLKCS